MAPEKRPDLLAKLISALREPGFYAHRPATVELFQTHISCVSVAGEEVYKVKKPVRFSFLDFSTLDRRRHFCHEEVRLNRRLAPSIYLGVVAIVAAGNSFRLAEESDPNAVEYAVHMRRLPRGRGLDEMIKAGTIEPAMLDSVAQRLVTFHAQAATNATITANGTPEAIWAILNDNFSNGKHFRGSTLPEHQDDLIHSATSRFLAANTVLLRKRQTAGRIRECHGDLHSDHVCFADSVLILDCIEFNTQFRYIDVASDIAFLAMDLDYLGRHDLSRRFVENYAELAEDPAVLMLLPFYACYRAYVRGKVDSLKSQEAEVTPEERHSAIGGAKRRFALAYRYAWSFSPLLIVVMGPSGSGKSTVAEQLQERLGVEHLNSDVIRKEVAGIPLTQRRTDTQGASLYTAEYSQRTYDTMECRAAAMLDQGSAVIVDATYQHRSERRRIAAVARSRGKPIVFIECHCDDAVVRERLAQRASRDDSPSDATWEIYQEQIRGYEPLGDDEAEHVLRANTTGGCAPILSAIESRLVSIVGRSSR